MRVKTALWVKPALLCGILGYAGLASTGAMADAAACKGLADAMLTNAKTPYHSLGMISFDPKNPPAPGATEAPKSITTETIFTGKQVFVKLPTGQWKDVHADIADLQSKVKESTTSFSDCAQLPNEKADGKDLAVYTGSDKLDAVNVSTKVWVASDGALVRTETDVRGPTAPDGKLRGQHLSLRYDYNDIKAPAVSN